IWLCVVAWIQLSFCVAVWLPVSGHYMASFVRVCVALLCVGADTRENDVVFAEVKQIDFKTTQPKTWCGFRDLDGVSSAEPLLIKSAEKFSFHWDSVLPEDEIVSVELSNSFTFKPYANLHQTSLPVTWAVAKKILKGEHPVSRTFASYIHQQSLLSPLDPFLSEIARHLPQCFSEIVAHKVLFWLGGSTNHTSGLHYDAVDNLYVMLEGSKEVILYPPWHAANLACGRRLTGNFFMFDEADFSEATISPRFPAQPRWMSECEDFKQVTKLRVQVEAGDILWIPSGWFHTVRSSPKSVATSIFHHGMAAVPHGMLVSLLNPKHLRSIFQETPVMEEAQHVLTAKILSAYPDLDFQDEEDGQDEKVKDQEVAESFNRHLHRYSATSRQSLQELQGPQVVGRRLIEALARRPLVATLAEALERQWHNLVRESDLDSALLAWTKSAVNNLSASSKATTISGKAFI
ncbi:unnamed protein product, partial [Durusdinium trenchii]